MMTVAEIMSTELYTLPETASLHEARQLMTEKHIRHLPIVNEAGHLTGLVTQRDLLAVTHSKLADVNEAQRAAFEEAVRLKDIMHTELSVVPAQMNLRLAALRMQAHKYGCLPVVKDGGGGKPRFATGPSPAPFDP